MLDKTFESETQTAKIEDLNVLQNKIIQVIVKMD